MIYYYWSPFEVGETLVSACWFEEEVDKGEFYEGTLPGMNATFLSYIRYITVPPPPVAFLTVNPPPEVWWWAELFESVGSGEWLVFAAIPLNWITFWDMICLWLSVFIGL
jgi:hypothetical protein